VDVTPLIPKSKQTISGYGSGGFKINNEFVSGSLLVFPDRTLAWDITDPAAITIESLQPFLDAGDVELLLIGTGKSIAYFDPAIRQILRAKNIAVDVLDTGAACRTYNILLAEERRVAAALIAV